MGLLFAILWSYTNAPQFSHDSLLSLLPSSGCHRTPCGLRRNCLSHTPRRCVWFYVGDVQVSDSLVHYLVHHDHPAAPGTLSQSGFPVPQVDVSWSIDCRGCILRVVIVLDPSRFLCSDQISTYHLRHPRSRFWAWWHPYDGRVHWSCRKKYDLQRFF